MLAFITNQAELRSTRKNVDMVTCKSAMNEKIRDSRETLKIRQHAKSQAVKNYLTNIGGRRFKLRKTIKAIRNIQSKSRLVRKQKYEKKIEHLRSKMNELLISFEGLKAAKKDQFIPTKVPERLQEYASLCIFKTSRDLPPKQELMGPFICNKDISLTEVRKQYSQKVRNSA